MRSYYNPATKLRKGEKPLTVLEKLQKSMSNIDLSCLSVAAERIGESLAAVSERFKEIKVPEIGRLGDEK